MLVEGESNLSVCHSKCKPLQAFHVLVVGCYLEQGCLSRMRTMSSWDVPVSPVVGLPLPSVGSQGKQLPWPVLPMLWLSWRCRFGGVQDGASQWQAWGFDILHWWLFICNRDSQIKNLDCFSREIIICIFLCISHRRPDCRPRLVGACQTETVFNSLIVLPESWQLCFFLFHFPTCREQLQYFSLYVDLYLKWKQKKIVESPSEKAGNQSPFMYFMAYIS